MSNTKNSKFYLDWKFVVRVGTFLRAVYPGLFSSATLLTVLMLSISIIDQFLSYFIGLIPSEFYVALGHRDPGTFRNLAIKSLALIVTKGVALAAIKYSGSVLYLNWRSSLVKLLHSLYFSNIAHYKLNVLQYSHIDNPDQRITQDVEKSCNKLAIEILAPLLLSPFVIAYYTYKTYASSGYIGPLAIYSYFLIATIINKVLLSPIVNLVVEQERKEGDFRFKHVAVRSHSEAIGFYSSETTEKHMANLKLNSLISVQQKLVNWQFVLNFSTNTCDYFGAMLSYFIIALPIFVFGTYDHITDNVQLTGIISQNSFFYMYLINCFSRLIDLSSKVGDFAGTTHRVVELLEALKEIEAENFDNFEKDAGELQADSVGILKTKPNPENGTKTGRNVENGTIWNENQLCECGFILKNYDISIPGKNAVLIKDLSIEIRKGTNILITGSSSSGKSSVLRVLSGLWTSNQNYGHIWKSGNGNAKEVMYIPQKSYIPNSGSTLRQQVMYPVLVNNTQTKDYSEENEQIKDVLRLVSLSALIEACPNLDARIDGEWQETLSPGEMQRLQLARVFFHKPKICFLDEATSALGFDMELKIYEALQQEGITVVSVGHRISLKRFHQNELHLNGDSTWIYKIIDDHSLKEDYSSCLSLQM